MVFVVDAENLDRVWFGAGLFVISGNGGFFVCYCVSSKVC